jgi:hypothetical protein
LKKCGESPAIPVCSKQYSGGAGGRGLYGKKIFIVAFT